MINRWHAEERELVLHQLGTHPARGLEPAESTRRLREHGPNLIRESSPGHPWALLVARFADAPGAILVAAAVVSVSLGAWAQGLAIAATAVLGATLRIHRERRTGRALAALRGLAAPAARVVRGGKPFFIPAAELVPGDLAEVAAGDRVPADLRLVAAERLFADESAITGEALPVGKDPALVLAEETALADRKNMLFAGTIVTAGRGVAVVTATGMRTEVGHIARLLEEVPEETAPLERRLAELSQAVAIGCLLASAAVFAALRLRGEPTGAFLLAAVSLAVAAVPEGLPAVVAAALAAGARKMVGRNAVVRALASVETLGAITVVGTDKTGTLTRNEMTVRELVIEDEALEVTGTGYAPEGAILRAGRPVDPGSWETLRCALRIAVLCSASRLERGADGSWSVAGDPTEGALLALAAKAGLWREDLEHESPLLAAFPFSADRRRMTVVVPGRGGRPSALTKGAPDIVLAHCLHRRTPAGVRPLGPADRERILRQGEEMAARALRVLGLAYREDVAGDESGKVERAMVWVGLVGMSDPPRPEVPAAVAACRAAGVTPVIVTGDHKLTALAVAREIGALRPGDEAISGEELDRLTPEALAACVERYRVYARVTAEHRLRIVRAWKRRGHLVAMTGDGVNDAPALKEADIGIALGRGGTEVTREAADLEIADDSFASIVAAVEEGRGIAARLRAAVDYLISCSAGAVVATASCLLLGAPLPLLPLPLLWLSLATAGLPALALALEPGDPALMRAPPRPPRERILGRAAAPQLLLGGGALALLAAAAFLLAWRGEAAELARARTHAFAVLGFSQIAHAFGCRERERSLFSSWPFAGAGLLAAAAVAGLLLAALIQLPLLGRAFGTVPLAREEWLRVLALSLLMLPAMELFKFFRRG